MKQQLLLILLTAFLSLNCYAKINYEKGYYIDNEGQKTEVLIKNIDWNNNPTEFEYKLSEDSESENATIKTVREFGINNFSKYSRQLVNIDRSSGNLDLLSEDSSPRFKEEELFLEVLIEGKANLYLYNDGNITRYFYSKDGSKIEQLIFKKYLTSDNNIGTNEGYKQQLWNDLKCPAFTMRKVENVDYRKNELVSFFEDYNKCHNQDYINFKEKQKKDLFNLNIRPGINFSSLSMYNTVSDFKDTDFGDELGFRLGIEGEFIMPFNKNKWAIILEPTYRNYKSEQSQESGTVSGGILITRVDYKSIELPIGVRHYLYFNDNSKLFLNASYVVDLNLDSTLEFFRQNGSMYSSLDIKPKGVIALGVGYKFMDKYSIEMRYHTSRELLVGYSYWRSDYETVSMIFGYSLF